MTHFDSTAALEEKGDRRRRMRLDRRHPCLHECEARKGSRDLRPAKFDVAEKRDVAGRDACGPVASAPHLPSSLLRVTASHQIAASHQPPRVASNFLQFPLSALE